MRRWVRQSLERAEPFLPTKAWPANVTQPETGQATGEEPEAHENSDQVLLLVTGKLSAEIGGKCSRMKAGDAVIIPPRVKHKFTNSGKEPAVTFNVYSPPEYSGGEKV